MKRRATSKARTVRRERAFTVRALVLNALLIQDGVGVRQLQAGIAEITGGITIAHSAVFTAGRALVAAGLVTAAKGPRGTCGGPPMLLYRITEQGREVAGDMRRQAERLLYLPQFKQEQSGRHPDD